MKIKKSNIISMDKQTKILLNLFNFFAPIAVITAIIFSTNLSKEIILILITLGIIIGIVGLFYCGNKYNHFYFVDNDKINICKKTKNKLKFLSSYSIEKIGRHFNQTEYICTKTKKPLFYTNPSIVSAILTLGPLAVIFVILARIQNSQMCEKLFELIPNLEELKVFSKTLSAFIKILAWLFIILIIFMSILALFIFVATFASILNP